MGQAAPGFWCGEGFPVQYDDDTLVQGTIGVLRGGSVAANVAEADRLLEGCPRELAETLRRSGLWPALRCRPWLSTLGLRGLRFSLQRCRLELAERLYIEARRREQCTYAPPWTIHLNTVDCDHVVSAGQSFWRTEASPEKIMSYRKIGLAAIRQGRLGIVLLAGGANFRLGLAEPPFGCTSRRLNLHSGKSVIQLLCERIRRIIALCREDVKSSVQSPAQSSAQSSAQHPSQRLSIPVFVMTSALTRRSVLEHFQAHNNFGLLERDVVFFDQPVLPILDRNMQLLPQSLGGEFAKAPGGTGAMVRALANCMGVDQLKDRGIECLHIVGTENVLERICDPVFIGCCRDLEADCAVKVVARVHAFEDLDLFCVKASQVKTQYADKEEAACGLPVGEAPEEMLQATNKLGELSYSGTFNSFYMSLAYIEDIKDRPARPHLLPRMVPYLDFHVDPADQVSGKATSETMVQSPVLASGASSWSKAAAKGVRGGEWPAETPSQDLACQRMLLSAAAEVLQQGAGGEESVTPQAANEGFRCDVSLEADGPRAKVRIRTARRGPLLAQTSLQMPGVAAEAFQQILGSGNSRFEEDDAGIAPSLAGPRLLCSLVAPSRTNAFVLEQSLLDYFVYTDRAIAFGVDRKSEFAPVRERQGLHTMEAARLSIQQLHLGWMVAAGAEFRVELGSNAIVEVSPLLSYEGEGMSSISAKGFTPPCSLLGELEDQTVVADEANALGDGLDTKPFYLQEYPQRLEMNSSNEPQFRKRDPEEEQVLTTSAETHESQEAEVLSSREDDSAGNLSQLPQMTTKAKPKCSRDTPMSAPPYEAGGVEVPATVPPSNLLVGSHVPAVGFWERARPV